MHSQICTKKEGRMRIVIDTNVLISGLFFGGLPRQILSAVVKKQFTACAAAEIVDEYEEIVQEMIGRRHGREKTCLEQ